LGNLIFEVEREWCNICDDAGSHESDDSSKSSSSSPGLCCGLSTLVIVSITVVFVDNSTMLCCDFSLHSSSSIFISHTPCGPGEPPFRLCSSLVHSLPYLLLFITFSLFPFLIQFTYFLLLSI